MTRAGITDASDGDAFEYVLDNRPYRIREARTLRDLDAVHRIVHDSIVAGGYMAARRGGRIVTYPELDASPLTTVLVATEAREVVGTVSFAADGPMGLPTDHHFQRETDSVRREGGQLSASFRIATDPARRGGGDGTLALDLIRWCVFLCLRKHGFDTLLFALNPKHETVYARLLGARRIARLEQLEGERIGAGATLMRLDRERIAARFQGELDALLHRYSASADIFPA